MSSAGPDQRAHLQVVRGSVWYIVSLSILSAGGLAYTAVAARVTSAELGGDAGPELMSRALFLTTALIFVNYASNMGLPVAVARFGPTGRRWINSLFLWALLYTTASSLVGTVAFFVAANALFPPENMYPLVGNQWLAGLALFTFMVIGQSFAVLVEARLVTLRRWGWVVARVVIVVLVRFPMFLIPALRQNAVGLLVIQFGPPALSGFIGAAVLWRIGRSDGEGRLRPVPPQWRPVLRFATVNYVAVLASQAPQFVLPLIVSGYEPDQYGAFYLAWTIITVVFLVPHVTSQTVLAEASRDRSSVNRQTLMGLAVAGGVTLVLAVGSFALSGFAVDKLYGPDYELTGQIMPRMVAAAVPWAVTAMLLARVRVLLLSTATVIITGAFAVLTLLPAAIMVARSGVEGAANAWFLGNLAAAAVAVATTFATRRSEGRVASATADI
ncbi:MAG: hypothetical protein KDB33_15235 [Acidimicrobiales bacterium]|nr:hypothetical protein [Acidimicrobiales bacterium]